MSRRVDAMEGSESVGEPAHQGRVRLRQAFRIALASQRARLRRRVTLRDGLRWFGRLGSAALALALLMVALFPDLSRWAIWGSAMVLASLASWWMVLRIRPSMVAQIGHLDAITDAKAAVLSAHHVVGEGNEEPLGAMDVPILEAALASLGRVPANLGVVLPWRELASMTVVGAAASVGLFFVPTGTSRVVLSDEVADQVADAATQVERLAALAPIVSEEEREALDAAAEEAAALREQLGDMAVRDAMDSMEQMEEALVEAGLRRGEAQESAAEAAAEALAEEPEMAEAVRERDLEALDRAVTQAAARREAADREAARRALEEAAQAAGEAGDEALEESLLRRRGLLDRRSEQAALARRLAEAMPELMEGELGRQLERLSRDGEGEALQEAAVDAMTEAWSRLSPEERARLAERLRSLAAQENDAARSEGPEASDGEAMSADDYERMLRETLTQLEEARAASGGEAAGGRPMPLPQRGSGQSGAGQSGSGQGSGQAGNGQAGNGQGSGQAGNGQSGSGQGTGQSGSGQGGGGDGQGSGGGANGQGNANGSGSGGGGGGGGQGPSGRETTPVESDSQLARVRPGVSAGAPSRAWTEWQRPQGLDGDGQATGGPTGSGASHGGGISRSRIPPDYEEHVRVYFDGANE